MKEEMAEEQIPISGLNNLILKIGSKRYYCFNGGIQCVKCLRTMGISRTSKDKYEEDKQFTITTCDCTPEEQDKFLKEND